MPSARTSLASLCAGRDFRVSQHWNRIACGAPEGSCCLSDRPMVNPRQAAVALDREECGRTALTRLASPRGTLRSRLCDPFAKAGARQTEETGFSPDLLSRSP